ncbi:MAG: phospholipase D-like domain-containing protein [Candidatus Caldarchaeum sp.]
MLYTSAQDDLFTVVIDFLSSARREILLCSYLLTMPAILAELVKARRRGCDVRVLLANDDRNKPVRDFLRMNGIDARLSARPRGILHAKYVIADRRALLATTNFTHDAMNNNYEVAYIVTKRRDVEKLRQSFHMEYRLSS